MSEAERELREYIGPASRGSRDPQDPDQVRTPRNFLEAQLRGGRARGRISRAAGVFRHRSHRDVGEADCRADAGLSRSDGFHRRAVQRDDPLPVGKNHRFSEVALRADQTPGHRFLARQPIAGNVPERLQNLLLLWRHQAPWYHNEFDRIEEVFPAASYQYVLYGMGFRTEVDLHALAADAANCRARDERESHSRSSGCGWGCRATASSFAKLSSTVCRRYEAMTSPAGELASAPRFELLNAQDHGALRLQFPRSTRLHFVQVVVSEFAAAAACCPVLLTKDATTGDFYAGAMLGFKPGECLLPTTRGPWWLRAIEPAARGILHGRRADCDRSKSSAVRSGWRAAVR